MHVHAYVDGFNLYYGGKELARGQSPPAPSWKWLDLLGLAQHLADRRWAGRGARVAHVTYCTAKVVGQADALARQAAYLRALTLSGSASRIEFGHFMERYRRLPRATQGRRGQPILVGAGRLQLVGVSQREEKGSDVNLASH